MISLCSPPPPSGFSTMLQPAFIFALLLRDTSHIITYGSISLFSSQAFLAEPFPKLPFRVFPSLCNPFPFKYVTSKLLIPKSPNDGPQVISVKGRHYLSPDFKPQSANTVLSICFLPPDQAFRCKKGRCRETGPERRPKQANSFSSITRRAQMPRHTRLSSPRCTSFKKE